MNASPTRMGLTADDLPTQRMLVNVLGAVAKGFEEAGCPLTADQEAFLVRAVAEALR